MFISARISRIGVCCLLLSMLPCPIWPQQKIGGSDGRETPQAFAQDFYNWYVPKALNDNPGPAWDIALRYRKHAFSPELFQALKDDSDAQAKASDLVGLDFDPFLNSQDPCESYQVGSSTRKRSEYRVNVYANCAGKGKKTDVPSVVAVLVRKGGQWRFVNFEYPDGGDLLSNLRVLRDDRRKSHGSKPKAAN